MSGGSDGRLSLSLAGVITRRDTLRAGLTDEARMQLDWRLLEQAEFGSVVNLALMRGADPDAKDMRRLTSLMHSAANRHTENIIALLTAGADALIEAPVIVRGREFIPVTDAGAEQPGDMPLTAPFMSIVTANLSDVQTFAEANIDIPQQWHGTFKAWAAQRDDMFERNGQPQRLTPAVDRLLKLTS